MAIALFVLLALLLLSPSETAGGGSGGGEGGGTGTGVGIGAGPGSGAGFLASGGTGGGASTGDLAASAETNSESAEPAASAPASPAAAASRAPVRIGFTAAEEQVAEPAPVAVTPAGGAASGGSTAGGGGRGDAPSFMGVTGRGSRVVYVIDCSGSMSTGNRFAHARYELKQSIRALPRDGEFFVIFFDHESHPMPAQALVRATPATIDRYSKWIDEQRPLGGTDPTEAMKYAIGLAPDTIFLMSDGIFAESAATEIRAANRRNISICTIAFHDPSGGPLLERIARENEGTYRFVAPPSARAP